MEEYILINDAILCVPGWLAAIGAFLKNNWQAVLSTGAQVVGAVGNLFSQKKTNEANAAEAEKARNWQERMYNLHESPAAQFAERKAAGLNVLDGIQSQSVGSASTAAPAQPLDFSSVAQLPLMFQQLKSAKLQNRNIELSNQSIEQDVKSKTLDNQMKALEAGNKELWLQYELDTMQHNRDYAKWSAAEKRAQALRAYEDARQLLEFGASGANIYTDTHDKIAAEIAEIKSRKDLTDTQKKIAEHTLKLSEHFDEKFLDLDLQQRQQEVKEFLDNADSRAEYNKLSHELYVEMQKLSKKEITDVKSKLTSVEAILADDLLNSAIDDDYGRFDTVMLKMFMNNPVSVLQVASNFVPGLTYAPTTKNYVKNILK